MKKTLITLLTFSSFAIGCQTVDQRNSGPLGRELPTERVVSNDEFDVLDDRTDVRGLTKYQLLLPDGTKAWYMAGRIYGDHKTRITTSQYLLDNVSGTKPKWSELGIKVLDKYR